MNLVSTLIGVFVSFIVFIIFIGGLNELPILIDIPSILMIISGAFFGISINGFSKTINAIKDIFSENKENIKTSYFMFKNIINSINAFAIIGFSYQLIYILGNSNPGSGKFYPSFALSLIILFYALTINMIVFLPIRNKFKSLV